MRKLIKYSTVALTLILMGCSQTKIDLQPISQPTEKPISNILGELNNMIAVFDGKPIIVLVDSIENKTGEQARLPIDITTIVNSSFNNIGEYVNIISNPNSVGDRHLYIIHGAITEFDVLETKNSGYNGDLEAGKEKGQWTSSGSLERESKISKLAITFNPEDIATGSFVTKSSTANKITIIQKSSSNDFGFYILGSGFGHNQSITKAQGLHSSIATLVNYSVAEVLGKLGKFPYWLLTKGKVNQNIVSYLSDEFLDDKAPNKISKISYLLALRERTVIPTTVMTPTLKEAIKQYQSSHNMNPNGYLSRELYISLLGG